MPRGQLALDRVAHLGHVVPDHVGQDAGEEVQIGTAAGVRDAAALAAHELDRLLIVQGRPVRHDCAVTGVEIRVCHLTSLPGHASGCQLTNW